MKRGEFYFIKSTYQEEGNEQRSDRPAVIVSNDKNNEHSGTVEVVYLTTAPKKDLPTHVFTRSALSPSTILCEQIYTVSKQRVNALIGELTDSELKAVDTALAISLGIDFGAIEIVREPTEEELKRMAETLRKEPPTIAAVPKHEPQPDQRAELIRAQAERDIFRDLYRELLEHVKGGTA